MAYPTATDLAPDNAWFKSSYSQENGTACVEVAWFKSSYSSETGNNCVEVADLAVTGQVAVRDSKDKTGPALLFPADTFAAFVTAVRAGHFPV
jgi:hypothetical protein